MNYVASIGRYADGRLAEIFLTNHKSGSDADAAARDSAVICSIALQHGVPIEIVRKALLRDSSDNPSSPIGCVLDLLARGVAMSGGPVFVIRIQSTRPDSDGIRGLRWILKTLLRRYGFVCTSAYEEQNPSQKMESPNG
jgi:hypothetical protein